MKGADHAIALARVLGMGYLWHYFLSIGKTRI